MKVLCNGIDFIQADGENELVVDINGFGGLVDEEDCGQLLGVLPEEEVVRYLTERGWFVAEEVDEPGPDELADTAKWLSGKGWRVYRDDDRASREAAADWLRSWGYGVTDIDEAR